MKLYMLDKGKIHKHYVGPQLIYQQSTLKGSIGKLLKLYNRA